MQPFTFRIVALCPSQHETEIFSARIDPTDTSTLAAAEAAIGDAGRAAKCATCDQACKITRVYQDSTLMEETSIDNFNERAIGKAPPRNYG